MGWGIAKENQWFALRYDRHLSQYWKQCFFPPGVNDQPKYQSKKMAILILGGRVCPLVSMTSQWSDVIMMTY